MVKIYTKTGDFGTTSLFGGRRVEKNSVRIAAYGEVDELNSLIGVILAESSDYSSSEPFDRTQGKLHESRSSSRQARTIIKEKLLRIQSELFVLGADLAAPSEVKIKVPRVKKPMITRLEKEIDNWSTSLPQLRNFILPGGSRVGSKLHLARAITRRAERSIVALDRIDKINGNTVVYINRLSDWFFVMARYVNKLEEQREKIWKGRH